MFRYFSIFGFALFMFFVTAFLAGCSLSKKTGDSTAVENEISATTGDEVAIDETGSAATSEEVLLSGADTLEEDSLSGNQEEIVSTGSLEDEVQIAVEELIEERKADLGDEDALTDEDVQLIEDILDELVKSVK